MEADIQRLVARKPGGARCRYCDFHGLGFQLFTSTDNPWNRTRPRLVIHPEEHIRSVKLKFVLVPQEVVLRSRDKKNGIRIWIEQDSQIASVRQIDLELKQKRIDSAVHFAIAFADDFGVQLQLLVGFLSRGGSDKEKRECSNKVGFHLNLDTTLL